MKRLTLLTLAAGILACDVPDSGVVIRGVLGNTEDLMAGSALKCTFEADDEPEAAFLLVLDTAYTLQHTYPIQVENLLGGEERNFGTMTDPAFVEDPNWLQPLRMDVRWECDVSGFSADLGPLILPTFDPALPFCLETRAEANESFRGFDVVSVSGQAIGPRDKGLVFASVVPYDMGRAFAEALDIATFADSCCRESTNCNGQNPGAPGCAALEAIFRALDPTGATLQVPSPDPTQPSEDLLTFRPFARFDGEYNLVVDPASGDSETGAMYPMRFRGVMEFVNNGGDLVTSTEYAETVRFCRACGPKISATVRNPFYDDSNACYAIF